MKLKRYQKHTQNLKLYTAHMNARTHACLVRPYFPSFTRAHRRCMRFWIHTRTRAHSAHAVDSVNIESSTTVCGSYSFFCCWCALGDTRLHLHLNVRFQRGCFVVGAEIHTTSFSPLPVTHLFVCVFFVRFVCCAISRMVERLPPVLW